MKEIINICLKLLGGFIISSCVLCFAILCIVFIYLHTPGVWHHSIRFKNCTNDTLYIGASHYDNIDSIGHQLDPDYNILVNKGLDTTDISLWKRVYAHKDCFVFPDSMCSAEVENVFYNSDTSYLFLIKYRDAKQYTWDEIRKRKLYHRHIVVRDAEGNYERNIRYQDN